VKNQAGTTKTRKREESTKKSFIFFVITSWLRVFVVAL